MRTALKLTGADALPLLHRLSTNSLTDLPIGEWRHTLFCEFRGRLLHRALVAHTEERVVWLLRDDADGSELAAFVERFVFREDVRIEDLSGASLPEFGLAQPLPQTLDEHGRIMAGRPRHGHEIAEAFTAYEVGLALEVHLAKGCYTGQEALQRLVTYDSARRRLVRVTGTGSAPEVPADVRTVSDTGIAAGIVTSAIAAGAAGADGADGGTSNGWVGLAALRRACLETGTAAETAFELVDGRAITVAHVFELTRPQGRPA